MILQIDHVTKYTYDEEVVLNPHDLLIIPQQRSYIKILDSDLSITPAPLGRNERINADGNPYFQVWFGGNTSSLKVQVKYTLEIFEFNPYGFILQSGLSYPFDFFEYPEHLLPVLHLYRQVENDHFELLDYVINAKILASDHISFLALLVANIHKDWKHIIREEEGLMTVEDMFKLRVGSCRDLSWLLMQMLRKVGMATRFVSGYAFNPELEEGHELHAWVEVFLPGAGWVGLDPSLGLLSDQNYIPLASSYHPLNTLPIYGTFGGKGKSHLLSEVNIRVLPS